MARILYIVAQGEPLLAGYLKAKVDARSPEGHLVEIKLDERRSERRQERRGHEPERRRLERRRRPSLHDELRSRGFTSVLVEDEESSESAGPGPALDPAAGWRPRSTRWQRAGRSWRRHRSRWVIRGLALLIVLGLLRVVSRAMTRTAPRAVSPPGAVVAPTAPAPGTRASEKDTSAASDEAPTSLAPARASGVVLSVDPQARTLVMEDMGQAGAEAHRLRIRLAPDARVVLSERDPGAGDTRHPFKDTAIGLSDIRPGDFVVVDVRAQRGQALAQSVVVTLRAARGSTW